MIVVDDAFAHAPPERQAARPTVSPAQDDRGCDQSLNAGGPARIDIVG